MPEKSLYKRANIPPLVRYHLRGVMDALKQSNCKLPMGEFRFIDRNGELHVLCIVKGEWVESQVIA